MSYRKAEELLQLAIRLAASRSGLSATDIEAELGKGPKAALEKKRQRMLSAMRGLFPAGLKEVSEGPRRYWSLRTKELDHLPVVQPSDLAILERAATVLAASNDGEAAARLRIIRDRLGGSLMRRGEKSYEADLEAMLHGHAVAARPGPRPVIDHLVSDAVGRAVLELRKLRFVYESSNGEGRERTVEPVGVLLGGRHYLVARVDTSPVAAEPGRWRMDRMTEVRVLEEGIRPMPDGYSFRKMARKAFGVYYNSDEYGEVVWRFSPVAARAAAAYHFHPDQNLEPQPDGSLIVRFRAAGHLEMAWHLYQWGDNVEVLEPPELAALVKGHQRSDFAAVP
ncbi:WYL domain-containing protein [Mesorhizobium sp. WSM3873]|uniref:helix-turn-helix transcriptional regulator n=1 Tax=Mesorhizobium sp. WSM3873 TaxID=1854056 RepID=UPI0007FDB34C|nr:WYL domain-containing protein [Mesorhizobium sp. WSM3873]OBQ83005.1 hypothetical protein A9K71_25870 [Mesorhizobium sp. WSM3873]